MCMRIYVRVVVCVSVRPLGLFLLSGADLGRSFLHWPLYCITLYIIHYSNRDYSMLYHSIHYMRTFACEECGSATAAPPASGGHAGLTRRSFTTHGNASI